MALEDFKIPLKTVIIIIGWVSSILGVYYTMKFKVDEVQKNNIELKIMYEKMESRLEKYNTDLLEYKVSNIEQKMNKIDEKTDRIQQLLSN